MLRFRATTFGLISLFATSVACQSEQRNTSTPRAPLPASNLQPTYTTKAIAEGGYVSSTDKDGVPKFIWNVGNRRVEAGTPEAAARFHLDRFAPALGLNAGDLETAELKLLRRMRQGGYLAKYKQKVRGLEVYPSEAAVLMRDDLQLVALSGRLRRAETEGTELVWSPQQALAAALSQEIGLAIDPSWLRAADSAHTDRHVFHMLAHDRVQMPEAQVRPILYAGGPRLVPAYFIEFYAGRADSVDTTAHRYILDARTGRLLEKRGLTADAAFRYRVFADAGGRPLDGPITDYAPHPTGQPDGSTPSLIASTLIDMEGFNTNPQGAVDPWLPDSATETTGNNVDAYSDHDLPDGYSNGDLRATLTGPRAFDRTFDLNADPVLNPNQTMASVTALFYVNNWLHNWWYDSGFDEAAGNAQRDNFGRGGVSGDVLRAEAQDNVLRGNRNNANMSTPSDGFSPRMQMYSWTGAETVTLTFTPGGQRPAGTAAFGPRAFDITGGVAAASPANGCTAVTGVTGRIAIVDRGSCTFAVKAGNAQAAGAIGILIVNNVAGTVPPGLGGVDPTITIPVMSMTQADGAALRTLVQQGAVSARMFRFVAADRDGSFDQSVVAHEWGHYLHHRLADCGLNQCRSMSEGWGDFTALFMSIREGDNLDGVYAAGIYATLDEANSGYFGIRRVPYSVNLERNALSFRHIADGVPLPTHPLINFGPNSEVHNSGEVWATMMLEAYIALQRQAATSTNGRSFDQVRRDMTDYVVAGLQMQPREASFTEARDGILAAILASNPNDMRTVAQAFARRGIGSCAISPPIESSTNSPVVEGFDLRPRLVLGTVTIDESVRTCDNDGNLDGDEIGVVTVQVANASPNEVTSAVLTLTASTTGVSFPAGNTLQIGTIPPFSSSPARLTIGVDPASAGIGALVLNAQVAAVDACETVLSSTVTMRINLDEVAGFTVDTVEASNTPWALEGPDSEIVWSRAEVVPLEHAWYGLDYPSVSDTQLVSPEFTVSATMAFVVSIDHRYEFEADTVLWDGSVIEVQRNGGVWEDIDTYVDPGYGGVLTNTSGNPLADRLAFVATSSAWPDFHTEVFDFGTTFAGERVRLRFRIGTDASAGAFGWQIDNIDVRGITNAPFIGIGDDETACAPEVLANAGPDQIVDPEQIVFLDGRASASRTGLELSYAWSILNGPAGLTLTNANTSQAVFTAPASEMTQQIEIQLAVGDGTVTATDTVVIEVRPAEAAVVTANAGDDQDVAPGSLVILDASRSNTTGTLPLSFAWTQVQGAAVTLNGAGGAVARFTAPAPDTNETLIFEVRVSDGLHESVDAVAINIEGTLLNVDAGADQGVSAGARVVLDGSGSNSSTNLPLTFSWRQVAGPEAAIDGVDRSIATLVAPEVEEDTVLEFELTASDGTRTATDTVQVIVEYMAPLEVVANAGSDQAVDGNVTVVLDGSASFSRSGAPLTYEWKQNSGAGATLSATDRGSVTFTAPVVKTLSVMNFTLTVSDGVTTATDDVNVTVRGIGLNAGKDDSDGCECTASSHQNQSSALVLLGFGAAALFLRRRRLF